MLIASGSVPLSNKCHDKVLSIDVKCFLSKNGSFMIKTFKASIVIWEIKYVKTEAQQW
jgi:hypothetical protein